MNAGLERVPGNPILGPSDVRFTRASGAFNPGAVVDRKTDRVVILFRVFEEETRRSCLGLALSTDGLTVDEVWDRPAVAREAPYEEWGVEDPRITWLAGEQLYAITYTGYSSRGPRVCLITTDDILDPERYRRHGPRIAGANKNAVVFPERIGGRPAILHRPMPRVFFTWVDSLQEDWPQGTAILGPRAGTWRGSRVGAGAPPMRTRVGWLFPFHGATAIEDGNVYSMGWCVLDTEDPRLVRHVSPTPVLTPQAPYEIQLDPIPQVDMANFPTGVRVVFPQGMAERGADLIVYYGAADRCVAAARVNTLALVDSLEAAMAGGEGAPP